MKVVYGCIHLIQNRLSSELLHCALCIAHCCIPRPQRTMDVTNFRMALQVPTMRQRHSCISHGSNVDHNVLRSWHATMYKFVRSMVLCGLGMQHFAMHNATIQKTTVFELGLYLYLYYVYIMFIFLQL